MNELPIVTKVLFVIGVVASGLAVAAVAMAAVELARGKPSPQRNFAVIVGATGVVLIGLKWVVPAHADELRMVSYLGTAFFVLGAGILVHFHRRTAANRSL